MEVLSNDSVQILMLEMLWTPTIIETVKGTVEEDLSARIQGSWSAVPAMTCATLSYAASSTCARHIAPRG
jgi:hypothetical protein